MNNHIKIAKSLGIRHNVNLRVLDEFTGEVIQEHTGHNAATNSLLFGIGHYLTGDGVFNQGWTMLHDFVPQYMSLGTMGLSSQEVEKVKQPDGTYKYYPAGIGEIDGTEEERFIDYMLHSPGFGADGYDENSNNGRKYFGLGPKFEDRSKYLEPLEETILLGDINFDGKIDKQDLQLLLNYLQSCCGECECTLTDKQIAACDLNQDHVVDDRDLDLMLDYLSGKVKDLGKGTYTNDPSLSTVQCELISDSFPRSMISYKEIIPEIHAELPNTIDIVFSALVSTGALNQFREPGKDYIFITEAGLWSKDEYIKEGGDNGLLAGYRIAPVSESQWDMRIPANREALKKSILCVGRNQVVQVTWKIQIGAMDQFGGIDHLYPNNWRLVWDEVY